MDSLHHQSLAGQVTGLTTVPKPLAGEEYSFPLASVQRPCRVGRYARLSEDKLDVFYNSILQEFKASGIPDDVYDRSVAAMERWWLIIFSLGHQKTTTSRQ